MDLDAFRTQIEAKLSLSTDDTTELALIDGWANDAVAYIVGETACNVGDATAALTADEGDYDLDTAVLRLLWVDNGERELEQVNVTDLRRLRLNGASAMTAPMVYALDGSSRLRVYPTPTTAGTLNITYVPRPATLVNGDDVPTEIPAEFHRLVPLYMLWQGGDYDDDQSSAQGVRYKNDLDEGIKEMRAQLSRKKGRRLPRAAVTRRRVRLQHRNDVDL